MGGKREEMYNRKITEREKRKETKIVNKETEKRQRIEASKTSETFRGFAVCELSVKFE